MELLWEQQNCCPEDLHKLSTKYWVYGKNRRPLGKLLGKLLGKPYSSPQENPGVSRFQLTQRNFVPEVNKLSEA